MVGNVRMPMLTKIFCLTEKRPNILLKNRTFKFPIRRLRINKRSTIKLV